LKDMKKTCTKCGKEKQFDEFCKDRSKEFGLYGQCKSCHNLCQKQRYQNNKEKIIAYQKQYQKNNKEKIKVRKKQYYQNNKEKDATQKKQYYHENREKILAYHRQYQKNNRKEIATYKEQYYQTPKGKEIRQKGKHKRRALKAKTFYESFNPIEVFKRDNYRCQHCGKKTRPDYKNQYHPLYPNLDHILPLSKGGNHTRLNTQCLCHKCNTVKNNKENNEQLRMFG